MQFWDKYIYTCVFLFKRNNVGSRINQHMRDSVPCIGTIFLKHAYIKSSVWILDIGLLIYHP